MVVPPARPQLPPRLLPILYVASAHVALALAFAATALDAQSITGFFFYPRALAIVHLITLGWITMSILGALYLVGPIALRVELPAGATDYVVFALVVVGVSGMAAHFWIAEYGGMGWSGATAGAGIVLFGLLHLPRLSRARVPAAVRAHIALAFANVAAAAAMGLLLAFNRIHPFLPGYAMNNVYAHAHLAAVGWASMMVVGTGFRLLPMVLPAAMPGGARLWITAVLLEGGVIGLFVTLVIQSPLTSLFAMAIVAGFGAFLANVVWMLRHPKPRPPAIPMPDPAVVHAAFALISLALAAGLGLWLSLTPTSLATLRLASVYGVLGLVGFLAQIVVAMEGRLLPIFAWYWAFAISGGRGPVPSPHAMTWRPGQHVVLVLWLAGLPSLACGMALAIVPLVRGGAWALFAATIFNACQAAHVLRHAYGRRDSAHTRR